MRRGPSTTGVFALGSLLFVASCTSHRAAAPAAVAPRYPNYTQPDVPASLTVTPIVQREYDLGWQRFQAGDFQGANAALAEVLAEAPGFYPAETALGDLALAQRETKAAFDHFTTALAADARYLPALEGRVQAALAMSDDLATAVALEQLLAVDPSREEARTRLGLIRLRIVQGQLAAAANARSAGRLPEAQTIVERALQISPSSPVLLRELADIERTRGTLPDAEQHARKAVELDSADPESLAVLGAVLEGEGKIVEAADTFARAVSLDPRPAWREKRDALRTRARYEALPAEYRAIPTAPTITRAQVAAAIGIDLDILLSRATPPSAVVVTDVRTNWAATYIVRVTQAGIMDAYPNHTFQPNAIVRRSDLAQVASQLLVLAGQTHPDEATKWRAARPRVDDVPAGHVAYRAIVLSVGAGAMKLDEAGRFWPGRPATGADLTGVIARLKPFAR